MDHDNSENADFQTREHGGVNIEVEGNDTMEEDHDDEDHDDQDDHDDDDDDDVDTELDVPILEKAHESLYEGSKITILATVLLLVNLKVMNGLSNVAMSRMLRYAIFVIFNVSIPLVFNLLTNHICFCKLIGEFLLPPSNILPHLYQELSTIMNQIGMKY